MKMLGTWTDDHLPCFGFEHNGLCYAISWTDASLVGRIELVQEGSITIEKAFAKFPGMLRLLSTAEPFAHDWNDTDPKELELDEDVEEGEPLSFQADVGFVQVFRNEDEYRKRLCQ